MDWWFLLENFCWWNFLVQNHRLLHLKHVTGVERALASDHRWFLTMQISTRNDGVVYIVFDRNISKKSRKEKNTPRLFHEGRAFLPSHIGVGVVQKGRQRTSEKKRKKVLKLYTHFLVQEFDS